MNPSLLSTPSTNPKCIHRLQGISFRGCLQRLKWIVGVAAQLQPFWKGSGAVGRTLPFLTVAGQWAGPLPTSSPSPYGRFAGTQDTGGRLSPLMPWTDPAPAPASAAALMTVDPRQLPPASAVRQPADLVSR